MAQRLPPLVMATLAREVSKRLGARSKKTPLSTPGDKGEQSSEALTQWLVRLAIHGFGPLESARTVAHKIASNKRYKSDTTRIDALVRQEANKSFTAGFLTSLPVPVALPAMLPVALIATWLIQARMVAAMAILLGHDADDLWVRTTVLLALDDAQTPKALQEAGLDPGQWASLGMAQHLAQPMLKNLWHKAGEALLKRAGRRGWTRAGRFVPVLGAVVAGGLDAYGCRQVAARSRSLMLSPPKRILP